MCTQFVCIAALVSWANAAGATSATAINNKQMPAYFLFIISSVMKLLPGGGSRHPLAAGITLASFDAV
jgi:hypothetical protein